MALMRDDIRIAKITTKPRFENVNLKFYQEIIPKAAKMKRNTHMKTTRRQRTFEKMSGKRGLVVNFGQVTQSRIRTIGKREF